MTARCFDLVSDETAPILAVALPYAGGAGRSLRPWAAHLPTGVALATIDLPGHGHRRTQPCLTGFDDAVADLYADLHQVSRPVVLVGYSMGARLAYELAHRLIAAARPPLGLVACMARAPHTGLGHARFASGCPESEFLDRAIANGLADPAMRELPELADTFAGVLRADLTIVESYRYRRRSPLAIPTCVLGASGDWIAPEPALRAWADLCAEPPAQVRIPGGHLVLHEQPATVARAVAGAIASITQLTKGATA
ncbi:MAG TPA: alpha/beta fold hydrolase [Micromonosporaceae bacterium]